MFYRTYEINTHARRRGEERRWNQCAKKSLCWHYSGIGCVALGPTTHALGVMSNPVEPSQGLTHEMQYQWKPHGNETRQLAPHATSLIVIQLMWQDHVHCVCLSANLI